MKCERARELFSDYLEGSVEYALKEAIGTHLDQCAYCRCELDAIKHTWNMLDDLPEVEPPYSFRHDVVMRAARIQHERSRETTQTARKFSLESFFGNLMPARKIAIFGAAAALALAMFKAPSAYQYLTSVINPGIEINSPIDQQQSHGPNMASPLSQMESERKHQWRLRRLDRNTLWISMDTKDNGDGRTLFKVTLSINERAVPLGMTCNRIWAKVLLLPPNQFGAQAVQSAGTVWQGNVLTDSPILVPVIVDRSQSQSSSVNLLVAWRYRGRSFSQVVYVPTAGRSGGSSHGFDFSVGGSGYGQGSPGLYQTFQQVAEEYGVPIVVNGKLDKKPGLVQFDDATMEDSLNSALKSTGLEWLTIDNAIHIDSELPAGLE